MTARSLRSQVCEDPPEGMGLCCPFGFLMIEDIKCKGTPEGRLTPRRLCAKTGFTYLSAFASLKRFREGKIRCEKKEAGAQHCIALKVEWKDQAIPGLDPKLLAWIKLPGSVYNVEMTQPIKPVSRSPQPIKARVIGVSQSQWLWLNLVLEYSPSTVKLGDTLILSPDLHGTVINIDGPCFTVLLPGDKHGQRNKYQGVVGEQGSNAERHLHNQEGPTGPITDE